MNSFFLIVEILNLYSLQNDSCSCIQGTQIHGVYVELKYHFLLTNEKISTKNYDFVKNS